MIVNGYFVMYKDVGNVFFLNIRDLIVPICCVEIQYVTAVL